MKVLLRILAALWLCWIASVQAAELTLRVADVQAPGISAQGVQLQIAAAGQAELNINQLTIRNYHWQKVRLLCREFSLSSETLRCHRAQLDRLPDVEIQLDYEFTNKQLQLVWLTAQKDVLQLYAQQQGDDWQVALNINQMSIPRLLTWLPDKFFPKELPLPSQGIVTGSVQLQPGAERAISANLLIDQFAFSDSSGQRAAEKMAFTWRMEASRKATEWQWQWQQRLDWHEGELFWQPLYLSNTKENYALDAHGSYDGKLLVVQQAKLQLPEAHSIKLAGSWDMAQKQLTSAQLQLTQLKLKEAFQRYAQPYFAQGTLSDASWQGQLDADLNYDAGKIQSIRLTCRDIGFADKSGRFALQGLNTQLSWQKNATQHNTIQIAGARLMGLPIGATQWDVEMSGNDYRIAKARLPILDGALEIRDFRLYSDESDWNWQFAGELENVSMQQFSRAASWPLMHGSLAGSIPQVTYRNNEVEVNGALLFKIFDGEIMVTQLKLADVFGLAPRLSGNVNMRQLDLDLLTRTFSFGNMQGRIDVDVNQLMLQNWQLLGFDAKVASSQGRYPKKISHKAVQNITALGGAGAIAALQRGYLSFFENFGYDQISWSCVLKQGVCHMGGLAQGKGTAYTLIKGAGIPAINVIGYNHRVSWDELISRLKNVIQNNAKPVVK